jgi:general transcription factor 3C polypeptide 5 (transcription factor C subunit 1)
MDDDDEPQAGPSNLGLPPPEQEAEALQLALSQVPFFSVEYPGYVAKDSIPEAIRRLGGEPALNAAFRRSNAAKKEALLELNLRPDNPFSHPIPGDIIGTSSILLRVRKKKYKHPREDAQGNPVLGEYVVDVPGLVQKTARFRSMTLLLTHLPY